MYINCKIIIKIYFQIVDGCITNDGDTFLYGAKTVYRDLCISGKVCKTGIFKPIYVIH